MNESVYIIDAKRTPIGKYNGAFRQVKAIELASIVIKALIQKNPVIKNHIQEVILGNVLSTGLGQNPARIAAYQSGIPARVPACTINKVCGSSLKAIIMAVQSIYVDDYDVVIAGGMENMSQAKETMIHDGLFCSLINESMGQITERIAKKYRITRHMQDLYAVNSHKKAVEAIKKHIFTKEIVAVPTSTSCIRVDEQPRYDTSIEKIARLKPGFVPRGTITAANACPLNDGAAAVIVAGDHFIQKYHIKPLAKICAYATVGLDPKYMGLGGYYGAVHCLEKAHMTTKDIDLWEINEAFACQSIAVQRLLKIPEEKINIHGGAIALGHPIGASGARILTTLLYALKRKKKQYGIASVCIGGGQGIAMLVENR